MATVTGFDAGINTNQLDWKVPTRKLRILDLSSDSLTVAIYPPSNAGGGYGGIRFDGGETTFTGSFDADSPKAVGRGVVTGIEAIWRGPPADTTLLRIDGFSLTLAEIQKGGYAAILAGDDTITGGALSDYLFGHAGDDVLYGLDGEDYFDGGTGADMMYGGPGNDFYSVDDPGDQLIEQSGGGIDMVQSSLPLFTLPVNVEELRLADGALDGIGNELGNVISGNALANRLEGQGGDDVLDGGAGADLMRGGLGNDTYVVDNRGDVVEEAFGGGIDTVKTSIAFTLPEHVENLELLGKAKAGTGNALANILTGNAGKNSLVGGDGDDVLIGLGGRDSLTGGPGADRFDWQNASDGANRIFDFNPTEGDSLDFRGILTDYEPGSSLGDFLRLTSGKKGATVAVDIDGSDGAAKFQAFAVLAGFDAGATSVDKLVADGSILLA